MNQGAFKLTEEQVKTYERDGVLLIKGVLDKDRIEDLRNGMEEVLKNIGPQGAIDESRGGRYAYDTFMWTRNAAFWRLQAESPLPSITAQLMRSSVSHLMADVMFTKEPNTPQPTPWHQDQPYGWYNGRQVISAWIPLDPVSLDSGALEYVRGSHADGKWYTPVDFSDGSPENTEFAEMPDIEGDRRAHDIVHFDSEPGDILFHSLLILHGAPGNSMSDRRRRAIAFRYAGDDATYAVRPIGPKPIWDPGIKHGDSFANCDLFPQVWPRVREIPRFWERTPVSA